MDKIDHDWFNDHGRKSCPNLTHLEYEKIIDKLENASTRTLISFDEARTLLPTIDLAHLKTVYTFWNERRTSAVHWFLIIFHFLIDQKEKNILVDILTSYFSPFSLTSCHCVPLPYFLNFVGQTVESPLTNRT